MKHNSPRRRRYVTDDGYWLWPLRGIGKWVVCSLMGHRDKRTVKGFHLDHGRIRGHQCLRCWRQTSDAVYEDGAWVE